MGKGMDQGGTEFSVLCKPNFLDDFFLSQNRRMMRLNEFYQSVFCLFNNLILSLVFATVYILLTKLYSCSRNSPGVPTKISCEVLRFHVNLVARLTVIIPPWRGHSNTIQRNYW